ncbi:MAG TPA: hypothetical protein VND65_10630 [Candidatus Binatia bacterium]|nr:hypothetical protein [Candidatus Binatia bacterium]
MRKPEAAKGTTRVEQPIALIISDDVDFCRTVTARWQMERLVPTFTMLGGELWPRAIEEFAIAIVGPLRRERLSIVLEPLHSTPQPLFCVCGDAGSAQLVRDRWPRASILRSYENWLDALVLAGSEAILRATAQSRARDAEQACQMLERQALLGRYMLEMRHNLNNALTSLLGNSDLLLLEPGTLSAQARGQIETIRNMTLRIHEVMQRFSSLEKELNVVAQQAQLESARYEMSAAAGN